MRRFRRLFQTVQWKLVIIYISLILIAMQLIGIYFIRTVEQSFVDNFTESLNYQADSLAINLESYLSSEQEDGNIREIIQNFVTLNNAGVQVIDQNGVIIGGSESEQQLIGQKTNSRRWTSHCYSSWHDSLLYDDPRSISARHSSRRTCSMRRNFRP